MTAFAQAALAASDLIGTKFASTKFGGANPRSVKIEAPQVESTGGGKQARESIVLKAADGAQSLTAGFLDVGLRSAEIRSFGALSMMYAQRHKVALDLPQGEYDAFIQQLNALLTQEGYVVKIVDEGAQMQKAQPKDAAKPAGNMGLMIGVGAVAALALIAAVVFLMK
jgi:hypothetical protein